MGSCQRKREFKRGCLREEKCGWWWKYPLRRKGGCRREKNRWSHVLGADWEEQEDRVSGHRCKWWEDRVSEVCENPFLLLLFSQWNGKQDHHPNVTMWEKVWKVSEKRKYEIVIMESSRVKGNIVWFWVALGSIWGSDHEFKMRPVSMIMFFSSHVLPHMASRDWAESSI